MRILKSNPLLRLVNSYLIDASEPSNISYLWNFGSLLAMCLIIQIVTGVTLAMHYSPNVLEAFNSIEHIMRDVNNGWLIRYLHSNTASAFFFLVYLHIGRGIYYGSYRSPRTLVWAIGTVILILMMGTAFLGYVYSPKWLNLSIYSVALIFLILVYYTIQKLVRKSKVLTHPCYAVNINNIKYNNLNNKSIYRLRLNNVSKIRYSTTPCLNKSGCAETSFERLNTIIEKLGLNLVYTY